MATKIYLLDKEHNLNVQVNRRPITPENIINKPEITWKTSNGKRILTVMKPKVMIGVNEKDGSPIFANPKLICPKCDGKGKGFKCPDCLGMGKILIVSTEKEAGLKLTEQSEEDCPRCKGKGTVNEKCDVCDGSGELTHFSGYEKMDITEDGGLVPVIDGKPDKTAWATKPDGQLEQFPQFEASEVMQVLMHMPKSKLYELYIDGGWDELEAIERTTKKEKIHDSYIEGELYRYAEELVATNTMAVGKYVKAKGFTEWFFVAFPTIRDDSTFGWLVGYWQCKIEQTHLRPVPKPSTVKEEEKIPAKSYLPDLATLVS